MFQKPFWHIFLFLLYTFHGVQWVSIFDRTETREITKCSVATRRPLKNKSLKLVQSRHMDFKKETYLRKNIFEQFAATQWSALSWLFFSGNKDLLFSFRFLLSVLRISVWRLQWLGDSIHLLLAILRRQGCLANRLNVSKKTNESTKESPKWWFPANVSWCLQN